MGSATKTQLEVEAGKCLFRAMFQAKSHFQDSIAGLDLTPPVAGALLLLEEPMPMSELADRIGCDPSYITSIADRLEELELAERQPWPSDRRVRQLVVTEEGRRKIHEIAHHAFHSNPLLSGLGEEDLHSLVQILGRALSRH